MISTNNIMATVTVQTQQASPGTAQLLDPAAKPPHYNFAFADFLKREYRFAFEERPLCKAFQQGHCPLGNACSDKHPPNSNYSNLICKHWLRGLCKKGDSCEFMHEYNLRMMPECTQFSRLGTCSNGTECLYLHLDPGLKQPPCPHYERGFCPLGPHCAARHVKRKTICVYYLAGFCPNGPGCTRGGHPQWKEKEEMEKPQAKKILSAEEQEEENQRLLESFERAREEERRDYEDRVASGRDPGRGRGRGRGRGWNKPRRGERY